MNIINNIKKTIAVTLLGGGMPLFIIFICLAILLTSVSVSSDDAYAEREGMQTIELFIQIANNEYETCGNVKGGDKYRKWYTGAADGAPWCATFVSYIAYKANILDTAIVKFADCDAGIKWFREKNQFNYTEYYEAGNSYVPQRGDLIFFSSNKNKNDSTHVGIIEECDGSIIKTIEGNSGNAIKKRSYSISNETGTILGYATPNYPSSVSAKLEGALSEAFKFFASNESGNDYNKGFSKGDGYYALGYYQFDSRYDLQEFLRFCYETNPTLYAPFSNFLNVSKSKLRNNKNLEKAWHQVYEADSENFAVMQDTFEYNNYYLPVESGLAGKGIDISSRCDALKGMCCSLSNWAGTKTAVTIIMDSRINSNMNDKEFVSRVYGYLYSLKYNDYAKYGKTGKKYYNGWHNRWKREKEQCLKYIQ